MLTSLGNMLDLISALHNQAKSCGWQTAEHQKDQSDIGNTGGRKPGQENENETGPTEWKLEEVGIEG